MFWIDQYSSAACFAFPAYKFNGLGAEYHYQNEKGHTGESKTRSKRAFASQCCKLRELFFLCQLPDAVYGKGYGEYDTCHCDDGYTVFRLGLQVDARQYARADEQHTGYQCQHDILDVIASLSIGSSSSVTATFILSLPLARALSESAWPLFFRTL